MLLSEKIRLIDGALGKSIICTSDLPATQRIVRFSGQQADRPSKYTVQRADNDHLAPDGALWAYINHSCAPNCAIDFGSWELTSRRPIRAGEEITFNYNSTEWSLAAPFECACAAPNCVQVIRGFRYLNTAQRRDIRMLLSPYLNSLSCMSK